MYTDLGAHQEHTPGLLSKLARAVNYNLGVVKLVEKVATQTEK